MSFLCSSISQGRATFVFLGLSGWYHRFIPKFSEKAAPLHALKQKKATWSWTDDCQKAFDTIKRDLTNALVLVPPDFTKPFKVHRDASVAALFTKWFKIHFNVYDPP